MLTEMVSTLAIPITAALNNVSERIVVFVCFRAR